MKFSAPSNLDPFASLSTGFPVSRHALPPHRLRAWFQAVIWSLRLLFAFDHGGSAKAQQCLKRMHPTLAYAPYLAQPLRILQAQKDAMLLKAWMHLIVGNRACFAESFALCAGLHSLGFPCLIVVGYAQIEQFTLTPLHAWVEYESVPLGNPLDVQYCYAEIHHYGFESIAEK